MKKRLLSIILAITMIASLLPTMAVTVGAEDTATTVYEFGTDSGVVNKTLVSAVKYSNTGDKWQCKGVPDDVKRSDIRDGRMRITSGTVGHWLALEITIPQTGWYEIQFLSFRMANNGGIGDVYLLPANADLTDIEAAVAAPGVIEVAKDVKYFDTKKANGETVEEKSVIEYINEENKIIVFKATGGNTAAEAANAYQMYPASLTLTKKAPAEDEALTNAFKLDDSAVTAYAPSVEAVTTVTGTSATAQANGSYKMVAPKTDENGNEFLYWAKGLELNKRIVSLEREFTYTPAGGDRNYLIPVYAPESATGNEYYNANGQLIDCATEAPDLPSMAGYGEASEWVQYKDTNIYVAEYDNKTQPDNVEVTVNGTKNTVPYGTDITCTAEDEDADNKPFKCWTKSNINGKEEIVSCDKSYTFKAWEDCTVTAVYEEHTYTGAKMKIIIDTFTAGKETGIMAEFIGLDSAVEKGIMFGTQKIAMTKPGTQFTVTADKNGTFKGYAIVKDGDGYTLITDGEAKITIAE